jgi:hypothetical protein
MTPESPAHVRDSFAQVVPIAPKRRPCFTTGGSSKIPTFARCSKAT